MYSFAQNEQTIRTCTVNRLSPKFHIFFCKTRTDYAYKTSRLVIICLLISALNKRVLRFFSGKLFYKSNRILFPVFAYPYPICITVSNSPNPSRVYIRLCKHGKCFLLLRSGTFANDYKISTGGSSALMYLPM